MSDLKAPFGDYNPPRSDAQLPRLPRLRAPRLLAPLAASGVTAALLAGGTVLRLSKSGDEADPLAGLFSVLVGTALLLLALLALPRAPRLAWAALTIAALLGLREVVGVVRTFEDVATGAAWRDLTLLASLAIVGGVWVAAGYADLNRWDRTRKARIVALTVLLGAIATTVAALAAVLLAARGESPRLAPDELSPLTSVARLGLVTIAGAFAVGVARDLGPSARRAAERLESDGGAGGDRLWRFLGYMADEVVPGRAAGRQRLAEAERARIAADLHALVLPDLRRAAASAAAAGAPEGMQLDLRRALEDVEQMLNERQSIVLEQFGLVAALEWLAERTEERSPLRVELDLGASLPEAPGAIDERVARAVFRIALLALDNVVRHADARNARIYLVLDAVWLRLAVTDDGMQRGWEPGPGARSGGGGAGRGLADMRAEAAASGGEITIETGLEGGAGAQIDARWPLDRVRGNASASHAAR